MSNGAVKRILKEAKEMQENASSEFTAAPLEDDLFEVRAARAILRVVDETPSHDCAP